MKRRDAKALGRWCDKHGRTIERVHLENGAAVTGCPECVTEASFVHAMDELVAAARRLESLLPPTGSCIDLR